MQEVSEDVDAWSSASSDAGFGADDNDSQFSDSDDQLVQLDADYDPSKETLAERIAALKDMVSPTTRQHIASAAEATTGWVKWSLFKAGNVAWIATTSALLVGLPLLLSIEGEAALVQQEKEYLAQVSLPFPSLSTPRPFLSSDPDKPLPPTLSSPAHRTRTASPPLPLLRESPPPPLVAPPLRRDSSPPGSKPTALQSLSLLSSPPLFHSRAIRGRGRIECTFSSLADVALLHRPLVLLASPSSLLFSTTFFSFL